MAPMSVPKVMETVTSHLLTGLRSAAGAGRVAEEALTVARDRRAAGYGSPVEVDRAQDAYRQAREDLIAAESDAAAAHFDLQHATGDIRRLVETGAAP